MDIALSILVTFLLTIANGYFSASELAVVSAKKAILEPEADEGDRKARAVLDLASDSGDFLATIQVAITLVGFAASAFAATSLSAPLGDWMASLGLSAVIARPLATVLITIIVCVRSNQSLRAARGCAAGLGYARTGGRTSLYGAHHAHRLVLLHRGG